MAPTDDERLYIYNDRVRERRASYSYRPVVPNQNQTYFVALTQLIFGVDDDDHDPTTVQEKFKSMQAIKEGEGQAFNYEVDDKLTQDEFEANNHHCLWSPLPDSIVALNLALCVCKQLGDNSIDFLVTSAIVGWVPLYTTFFIELKTVFALWKDNSDLSDNEDFCEQDEQLQWCVIGIFLLTLLGPFHDIMIEAAVGLSSRKCVYDAQAGLTLFLYGSGASAGHGRTFVNVEEKNLIVKEVKTTMVTWFFYWTSVGLEFAVLILTVVVGTYYTLSQGNASDIVQAAVAISFINEIDNMVYDAVASVNLKKFMSTVCFQIPIMRGTEYNSFYSTMYQLAFQTPLIMGISYIIVEYLREKHCSPVP